MGYFKEWLLESLTPVTEIGSAARQEKTTLHQKADMVGGVANLRQLVAEYREKCGDAYSEEEDPLFMSMEKFVEKYSAPGSKQ